jgi:hypothetical protein
MRRSLGETRMKARYVRVTIVTINVASILATVLGIIVTILHH